MARPTLAGIALVDLPRTDQPLLLALQTQSPDRREAAWALFEPRYQPVILAWCRRALSAETAEELTQDILLKLSVQFSRRCYDSDRGRFRAWLKVVIQNAVKDHHRKSRRRPVGDGVGGDAHGRMLDELAGSEAADLLSGDLSDQPVSRAARAISSVRDRVPAAHWRAFCLRHNEGLPVAEIAAHVGLGLTNVYKILHRIKKQLELEIGRG